MFLFSGKETNRKRRKIILLSRLTESELSFLTSSTCQHSSMSFKERNSHSSVACATLPALRVVLEKRLQLHRTCKFRFTQARGKARLRLFYLLCYIPTSFFFFRNGMVLNTNAYSVISHRFQICGLSEIISDHLGSQSKERL